MAKKAGASAGEARPQILAAGFGARVEEAARAIGSLRAAAKAMGRSHGQMRNIIDEQQSPSFESVAGLAAASGYRLDWLASGIGPKKASGGPLPEGFDLVIEIEPVDPETGKEHLRAIGQFPVPRALTEGIADHSMLRAMRVRGDGFVADLRRDVWAVVVREVPAILRDGELYVFNFGGQLVLRRVRYEIDGALSLHANNPQQPPQRGQSGELRQLSQGRVLGIVGRL